MDANLQGPLKALAEALHHAIEESSGVEQALAALRERGLSAVLLLEVTVALSKNDADGDAEATTDEARDDARQEDEWVVELPAQDPAAPPTAAPTASPSSQASVPIGPADREFLRSLRIRLD